MSFNAPEATKRIYRSVRPTEIILTQAQNMWCSFNFVTPRQSRFPRRPKRHARKAIQLPADQMAQRMARKCINRQQNNIHQHDQRAHPNAETGGKEEGANGVIPEEGDENHRDVEKIAMYILKNERESGLAAIFAAAALPHSAPGRIQEKRAIVGLPVVVASRAKTKRPS